MNISHTCASNVSPSNDEWVEVMTNYYGRYIMNHAASVLPRWRITKIRLREKSECLKFHTSTFSFSRWGMHVCTYYVTPVCRVWDRYLRFERCNADAVVDDSNLLSMPFNFVGPGHLLASGTRIISDRVQMNTRMLVARKSWSLIGCRLIGCNFCEEWIPGTYGEYYRNFSITQILF